MAFHEIRFPDNISRGARGGPERRTQVVELASGDEERNASWANSRRRYDVTYGIRRADDLAAVVAFFEARNARLYGFRYKDWADYKSCMPSAASPGPTDQLVGTGNGLQTVLSLGEALQLWRRGLCPGHQETRRRNRLLGVDVPRPEGPELLTSWNNLQTGWSNTGATGVNSAVNLWILCQRLRPWCFRRGPAPTHRRRDGLVGVGVPRAGMDQSRNLRASSSERALPAGKPR